MRLEPPYLLSICFLLALTYTASLFPAFRGEPAAFDVWQILFHVGYLISYSEFEWLNPVFWSLAIEFQFYLLIAFLFPLFLHPKRIIGTIVLLLMLIVPFLGPQGDLEEQKAYIFTWLPYFALGIVGWQYHAGLMKLKELIGWLFVIGVVLIDLHSVIMCAVGLVTILCIVFVDLPYLRVPMYLGTISYSLYLLHVPVGSAAINLFTRLEPFFFREVTILMLALAASIAVAALMYHLVEKPSSELSRRIRYET